MTFWSFGTFPNFRTFGTILECSRAAFLGVLGPFRESWGFKIMFWATSGHHVMVLSGIWGHLETFWDIAVAFWGSFDSSISK